MHLHPALAAAALSACLVAPVGATVVQATAPAYEHLGYMGQMTDLQVISGDASLPSFAYAFCIDSSTSWPQAGSVHQYTLTDSFAPFMSTPTAINNVTALLHYAVDYYLAPLRQGDFGIHAGYGFNMAVWQLTKSDGTLGSLALRDNPNGDGSDPYGYYALYTKIMGDLADNYGSITPDYRSERYTIQFLEEPTRTSQSLAIVSEKTNNEVPEPSSLALVLAGGIGLVMRARRKQHA